MKRLLSLALAALMMFPAIPLSASAAEPESAPYGALEIVGDRGDVYGYVYRNLEGDAAPADGDYTVSYDLKNPVPANYSISLWSARDQIDRGGNLIGGEVVLINTTPQDDSGRGQGNYLRVAGTTYLAFPGDATSWNHLEFRIAGGKFTIWVNGVQLQNADGTLYEAELAGGVGPVKTLGLFGDTSADWANGTILIDNMKVEQGGETLYLETFNGKTVDGLKAEGWSVMANPADAVSVNPEEDADMEEELGGAKNSLQVSGNGGTPGWARYENLNVSSDNYSLSFDYKNLELPDADNDSNCFYLVAQFNAGNLFKELIRHNTKEILIGLDGQRATIPHDVQKWTHFEIRVTGTDLEVFVDGESVFTATIPADSPKPTQFGWLGDGNAAGAYWDGAGVYDNICLTQDGEITWQEDFDGKTLAQLQGSGWTFSPADAMAISPMDASDVDGLGSLTVEPSQTMFTKELTVKLSEFAAVSAMMTDGTSVPGNKMNVSYRSSDPSVAQVLTVDGVPALRFLQAGKADITAELTIDGITRTASFTVEVIDDVRPVALEIGNAGTSLMLGSETELQLVARLSDRTQVELPSDDYALDGLTVSSSAPDVVAITGGSDTGFTMKAAAVGSAEVTVSGTLEGADVSAKKTFNVVRIDSVRAEILANNLYQGDDVAVAARGVLSNGGIVDLTGEAAFTAENGEIVEKDGQPYLSCGSTGAVTLTVSYSGMSASASAEVKEIEVGKTRASYYTEEKVENARDNVEKYAWARSERDSAVQQAEEWLKSYSTYEALWSVVPSQDIGRTFGVNPGGCLVCGRAVINSYGNYPYRWETDKVNWKITCPYCSVQFPSNDFAAYYENGLNEAGEFDAELAKARNDELIAQGQSGNLVNLYAVNGLTEAQEASVRTALANAKNAD
ncbi:MAG TPA: hypothetical protein H9694_05245, partial [Firmicutes bacterium]|nr:hypothetical protein [Bacillota bacterium]